MPNLLRFSLPDHVRIDVASDTDISFSEQELLVLGAYVPGIKLAESGPADITIRHYESDTYSFSETPSTCTIHDAWRGSFPDDLYHLLYALARRAFIERGLYPVHSICIGNDSQVLAVGHSGVGKTSLLAELVASHGSKMLASNKTLVSLQNGSMTARAGTRTISVRMSDAALWPGKIEGSATKWGRYLFRAGGSSEAASPRPIKSVAIVRLNDAVEQCEQLSPSAALHTLFPYFLDVVNADVLLGGGKAVLPGSPSPKRMTTLATELRLALDRTPVYVVTGSREYTARTLFSL